jgi:hypothetical protein
MSPKPCALLGAVSRLISGAVLAVLICAPAHPAGFPPTSWTSTGPLVFPTPDATHPIIAVKDPSVVFHDGRWHVFATTAATNGAWSMAYFSFSSWEEAPRAKPFYLDQNPNLAGYNCAPQVFYFRPQKKWYMIFQSPQPRYSTTDKLDDPMSWSAPQDFFHGKPGSVAEDWLDYWVICDDTHAYLFFPDDHGRFYRSRTRLEDFPRGFDEPVVVMREPRAADLFEGSCVYRLKDRNEFLCLVECMGREGRRYYRAFTTDRLDGTWKPLHGADSDAAPFAGAVNVSVPGAGQLWTNDISHGELLRDGCDETMTVDPRDLRLLYQGVARGTQVPSYVLLPYRLALLRAEPLAAQR